MEVVKRSSWQDNIGKQQLSIDEIIQRGQTEGESITDFDVSQNEEKGKEIAAEFSPVLKTVNYVVVSGANSEIDLEIQVTDILNCLKRNGIKVDLERISNEIKAENVKNFVISSTETRIIYALPVEEILVAGGDTDIKFYDSISGKNRFTVSQIMYGSGSKRMKTFTELRSNDGEIKVPTVPKYCFMFFNSNKVTIASLQEAAIVMIIRGIPDHEKVLMAVGMHIKKVLENLLPGAGELAIITVKDVLMDYEYRGTSLMGSSSSYELQRRHIEQCLEVVIAGPNNQQNGYVAAELQARLCLTSESMLLDLSGLRVEAAKSAAALKKYGIFGIEKSWSAGAIRIKGTGKLATLTNTIMVCSLSRYIDMNTVLLACHCREEREQDQDYSLILFKNGDIDCNMNADKLNTKGIPAQDGWGIELSSVNELATKHQGDLKLIANQVAAGGGNKHRRGLEAARN